MIEFPIRMAPLTLIIVTAFQFPDYGPAPIVKRELLLPSRLGVDSWGRLRREHGELWGAADIVSMFRLDSISTVPQVVN